MLGAFSEATPQTKPKQITDLKTHFWLRGYITDFILAPAIKTDVENRNQERVSPLQRLLAFRWVMATSEFLCNSYSLR